MFFINKTTQSSCQIAPGLQPPASSGDTNETSMTQARGETNYDDLQIDDVIVKNHKITRGEPRDMSEVVMVMSKSQSNVVQSCTVFHFVKHLKMICTHPCVL